MDEFDVSFEIHLNGESLVAEVTLEQSLCSVPLDVFVEGGTGIEVLAAHLTLVFAFVWKKKQMTSSKLQKKFKKEKAAVNLTSMVVQVFLEVEFMDESFATSLN